MHTEDEELLSRERRRCCIVGVLAASMHFVGQHLGFLPEGKREVEVAEKMGSRTQLRNDTAGNQAAVCFVNRDATGRMEVHDVVQYETTRSVL